MVEFLIVSSVFLTDVIASKAHHQPGTDEEHTPRACVQTWYRQITIHSTVNRTLQKQALGTV
jgi:hypothetical protein